MLLPWWGFARPPRGAADGGILTSSSRRVNTRNTVRYCGTAFQLEHKSVMPARQGPTQEHLPTSSVTKTLALGRPQAGSLRSVAIGSRRSGWCRSLPCLSGCGSPVAGGPLLGKSASGRAGSGRRCSQAGRRADPSISSRRGGLVRTLLKLYPPGTLPTGLSGRTLSPSTKWIIRQAARRPSDGNVRATLRGSGAGPLSKTVGAPARPRTDRRVLTGRPSLLQHLVRGAERPSGGDERNCPSSRRWPI